MKDDGIQIKGIKAPHILMFFLGLAILVVALLAGRWPKVLDDPKEVTVQVKN